MGRAQRAEVGGAMRSSWTPRIIGMLIVMLALLALLHLEKQLLELQKARRGTTTQSTTR